MLTLGYLARTQIRNRVGQAPDKKYYRFEGEGFATTNTPGRGKWGSEIKSLIIRRVKRIRNSIVL